MRKSGLLILICMLVPGIAAEISFISSCSIINQSGVFMLNRSIFGHADECLTIDADNVIFDGNSFSLTGDGLDDSIGIYVRTSLNVTVTNFRNISDFEYGLVLSSANDSLIEDIQLDNKRDDIYLVASNRNKIINVHSKDRTHLRFSGDNLFFDNNMSNIYLYQSSDNIVSNNSIGIAGIDHSSGNLITSNRIDGSEHIGGKAIHVSYGSNNTIANNTVAGGIGYGIYMNRVGENNKLIGNTIADGRKGIHMEYCEASSQDNSVIHNMESTLFKDIDEIDRFYRTGAPVVFNITYPDLKPAAVASYDITIYPNTEYQSYIESNKIFLYFVPEKEGVYSLRVNVSVPTGDQETRNFYLLVGDIKKGLQRYYMHEDFPQHGQPYNPVAFDSGAMLGYPTSEEEIRYCGAWVQFSPDYIGVPMFLIYNITAAWQYSGGSVVSSRLQRYTTLSSVGDYLIYLPVTENYGYNPTDYTFNITSFYVNITSDYIARPYYIALKLVASWPYVKSNASDQSYADIWYYYSGPKILDIGHDIGDTRLLAAFFSDERNATFLFEGGGQTSLEVGVDELYRHEAVYNGNSCAGSPGCSVDILQGSINISIDVDDFASLSILTLCEDKDGDGYNVSSGACGANDCNDSLAAANPGEDEICDDDADNDCDLEIDEDGCLIDRDIVAQWLENSRDLEKLFIILIDIFK